MSRTTPIVIAERVTDVAGLVLLGAVGLGVSTGAWWFAALLIAGVVFLGAVVGSRTLGSKVAILVSTPQRVRRFRQKLLEMLDALRDMVTWKAYIYGSFLSVIAWGAHGATLMLAANVFPDVNISFAESQVALQRSFDRGNPRHAARREWGSRRPPWRVRSCRQEERERPPPSLPPSPSSSAESPSGSRSPSACSLWVAGSGGSAS